VPPGNIVFSAGQLQAVPEAGKIIKQAGVEAKLVVKPGDEHGWPDSGKEAALIVDWFDAHLKKRPRTGPRQH